MADTQQQQKNIKVLEGIHFLYHHSQVLHISKVGGSEFCA